MKPIIFSILLLTVLMSSIEAKHFTKCKTNHLMTRIIRQHKERNGNGHNCHQGANADAMSSFMNRCRSNQLIKLQKKLSNERINQCQFDCKVTKKCMKYRLGMLDSIFKNKNYWKHGQGSWSKCSNRDCKSEKWCSQLPQTGPLMFWRPEQCIDQFTTNMKHLSEQLHYIKQLEANCNKKAKNRWGWRHGRNNYNNNDAQIERHVSIAQEKWRAIGRLVEGDCLSNLYSGFETLNAENEDCFLKLNTYFIWLRIFLNEPTLERMKNLNIEFKNSQKSWKNIFKSCKINCNLKTGETEGECNSGGGGGGDGDGDGEEQCIDTITGENTECTGTGQNIIFYEENSTCDCETVTCSPGELLCKDSDPTNSAPWQCKIFETSCPEYTNIQNAGTCEQTCDQVPLGPNEQYVQIDGIWTTTCVIHANRDSTGACVLVPLGTHQEYYLVDGIWTVRCVQFANDLGNGNCHLITLEDNQEHFIDSIGNWGARCVSPFNADSTGTCVQVPCTETGASIVETTENGQTVNNYVCQCPTNQELSFVASESPTCTCPSTAPLRQLQDGKAACGCPTGLLPKDENGVLICEEPPLPICDSRVPLDFVFESIDPTCECADGLTLRKLDTTSAICGCPSDYREVEIEGVPTCELIPACQTGSDLGFSFASINTQTTCTCANWLNLDTNGNAVCGTCPENLIQVGNVCEIKPMCGTNQDLGFTSADVATCDCESEFYPLTSGNLACKNCDEVTNYFNPVTGACVFLVCDEGFVFNVNTGVCDEDGPSCEVGVYLDQMYDNVECSCESGLKRYNNGRASCGTCLAGFKVGTTTESGIETCISDTLDLCVVKFGILTFGDAVKNPSTGDYFCECGNYGTGEYLLNGLTFCGCKAGYQIDPSYSPSTHCIEQSGEFPATDSRFYSTDFALTGYYNFDPLVNKYGCKLSIVDQPLQTGTNSGTPIDGPSQTFQNCACAQAYGLTAQWYDAAEHIPTYFEELASDGSGVLNKGSHCCKFYEEAGRTFQYRENLANDDCFDYSTI